MFSYLKKLFKKSEPSKTATKESRFTIGSLWYIPSLNDGEPILKITKVKDGYIYGEYLDDENKSKIFYQSEYNFSQVFCQY